MRENIPMELRQLPQWVCAGPDKVPISPRTGAPASVTDPNTWATFEEAVRSGMRYIGFVLTAWDPYTIIDLDNKPENPCTPEEWARHQKILEAFASYTERSASGHGYHIIVRGSIPAGMKRSKVEVYSSQRYMICTGDVVRNLPITDYQPLLDVLVAEMEPVDKVALVDVEGPLEDRELVDMALRADNGEKFNQLCLGDWQAMGYPSQSEADFALLSILAFYTQDNEQVRRVFRMSGLGKRDKAVRDDRYLNFALSKIRAKQPAMLNFDELVAQANAKIPPNPPHPSPLPAPSNAVAREVARAVSPVVPGVSLPPGLIGEIAQYIYQSAVRPVPEISLAAAIGLVAGIAGRSYNISGSGLNQYIVLLAKTGSGKEGAATGINNLIAAVRPQVPMVDQFIGPAAFASGQALIRVLDQRPCFVSVLGEIGLTLQQLSSSHANGAQIVLKKVLLDLYAKSGWNQILRSSVYADAEKNTQAVQAPCLTILGESTPEAFFDGLEISHVAEGLIPRFLVMEYTGPRPPRNRNAGQPPSAQLAQKLADLTAVALTTANNGTCAVVGMEANALALLDKFDREADAKINGSQNEAESQIWNRAHLKALKLAALLAVGVNPHNPVVTPDLAEWSIDFVQRDMELMTTRFRAGDIGQGESKQHNDLERIIDAYLELPYAKVAKYGVTEQMHSERTIPYLYLVRRTANLSAFKNDKKGASFALRTKLQDMVDGGMLLEVPLAQVQSRYGMRTKMYVRGPAWDEQSTFKGV